MTRLLLSFLTILLFATACSSGGGTGTTGASGTTTGQGVTSGGVTGGSGGTGGASTGISSSGTTTGSPVVGACSAQAKPLALVPCLAAFPCGCPLSCVADPAYGGSVCESTCISDSQCDDLATRCVDGFCRLNACASTPAGESAPGTLNAICDASGTADGTCVPMGTFAPDGGFASTWGVCVQGGSSDGGCLVDAGRSGGSSLCPAGSVCASDQLGCQVVCDLTVAGGCDGGSCSPVPGATSAQAGYCGPLRGMTACGEYPPGPYGLLVGQALPWTFQDLGYWDPSGDWIADGGIPNPTTQPYFELLYCSRVNGSHVALVQLVTADDNHSQGDAVALARDVKGPDADWLQKGGQVMQVIVEGHQNFPPNQAELTSWAQNSAVNFSLAIDSNQELVGETDATYGWPVTLIVDLDTMRVLGSRSYAADFGQIYVDFENALDGG